VSFKEIKKGLAELSEEQQDRLAAYLIHLRYQLNAQVRRELSSRLDDKNPGSWERWREV
jgi:hypothetical protein